MNKRNIPPEIWLLCLEYVADVMNMTAERSLGYRVPLSVVTGETIDISILLCFLFWDIVYVARYDERDYSGQIGSTKSSEIRGRMVGFAWNVGHAITFKILIEDTGSIIERSRVRLADDPENNILKIEQAEGKTPERVFIRSKRDKDATKENFQLPTIPALEPLDISTPAITVGGEPVTLARSVAPERGEQLDHEAHVGILKLKKPHSAP